MEKKKRTNADPLKETIKAGSGGARPGAGRKKTRKEPVFGLKLEIPISMVDPIVERLEAEPGLSRTAWILGLMQADIEKWNRKKG